MANKSTLPSLVEREELDPANFGPIGLNRFRTGEDGDADIVFHCEFAGFNNTVGVYLLDADGNIGATRVVFPDASSSVADPKYPKVVDGEGPVDPLTTVSLSSLFDNQTLEPGQRFGMFIIQNGANQNDSEMFEGNPELEFVNKKTGEPVDLGTNAGQIELVVKDGDEAVPVNGKVFHAHGGEDGANNLNPGKKTRAIARDSEDEGGVQVAFEDQKDGDFNDLILEVLTDGAEPSDFGKGGGDDPDPDPEQKRIDLDNLDGENGTVIDSFVADRAGTNIDGIGDFNGDGIDDLVIGADRADLGGTTDGGAAYVVYGKEGGLGADFDLRDLDGTNGFVVHGNEDGDRLGWSAAGAGDVNGDGYQDVILGGLKIDGSGPDTGGAVLLFGSDQPMPTGQSVDELLASGRAIKFDGIDLNDETGVTVDGAGDINGDGYDDLLIGARLSDPEGARFSAGETYVVFGGETIETDLSALDGTNGMIFEGQDWFDQSGRGVARLDDINGDGIDDFGVGAPDADPDGNTQGGEAYVIFGDASGLPATLEPDELDGTNGFAIKGDQEFDFAGFDLDGIGDVNGDGINDILIGSFSGTPTDGPENAGEAYVLFGSDQGFEPSIDLSELDGSNGFRINGIDEGDMAGRSVSAAGDFNGDGINDFLIGAQQAQDADAGVEGEAYLIFGNEDGFDASFDLASMTDEQGCIFNGIRGGGVAGFDVAAAGDLNGDGFDDIMIGEPGETTLDQSGRTYVLYGGQSPGTINVASLFGDQSASDTAAA